MTIDHLGYSVSDFAASRAFYAAALAPLNMGITSEGEGWAMIGKAGRGSFWIGVGEAPGPIHVAFAAATREQVRRFHAAALAAGGRDNGAPGLRPRYSSNYYGAFVIGPDGHNVEAVCRAASE